MTVTRPMKQRKRKTLRPIGGFVISSSRHQFVSSPTVVHQQLSTQTSASPLAISSSQSYIIEGSAKGPVHLTVAPVTQVHSARKSCNGSCDIFSQSIIHTGEHIEPGANAMELSENGIIPGHSTDGTDSGQRVTSPNTESSASTKFMTSFKYLHISLSHSSFDARRKLESMPESIDYHSSMRNISNVHQLEHLDPTYLQNVLPKKLVNLSSVNLKSASPHQTQLSAMDSEDLAQNHFLSNDSSISYSAYQNASEMTSKTVVYGIRGKEYDAGLSSATAIGLGVTSVVAFWLILGPLLLLLARRSLRRARGAKDRSPGPRRFQQGYGLADTNTVDLTSMNHLCPPLARAKLYRTNLLDDSETERFQVLYSAASIEVLDNSSAIPRGYISVPESSHIRTSAIPRSSSRLVPSISSDYRISPSDSFHPTRINPSNSFHPTRTSPSDSFHLSTTTTTFEQSSHPPEDTTYVNDKDMLTGLESSDDIGYETLAVNNHSSNFSDLHRADLFSPTPGRVASNPVNYGIRRTEKWSGINNTNNELRNILRVPPLQPKMNSSTVGFMTVASHYPLMTPSGVLSKRCKRFPTMGQTCLKNSYARSHNTGAGEVTYSNSRITARAMTDSEVRNVSPGLYFLKNVDDVITNNFADLPQNLFSSNDVYTRTSELKQDSKKVVLQ